MLVDAMAFDGRPGCKGHSCSAAGTINAAPDPDDSACAAGRSEQRQVSELSKLCTLSGTVAVYADDGRATAVNAREIAGCSMRWKGQDLHVSVRGAVAIGKNRVTFATAQVSVVPPDARPLCPDICGPQPLADSAGDITVSGVPRSIKFSLLPNPVSLLNAKPTVWLEADVVVGD